MNIIAKITRNAVVKTTNSGKEVVNFGVAIRHTLPKQRGRKNQSANIF